MAVRVSCQLVKLKFQGWAGEGLTKTCRNSKKASDLCHPGEAPFTGTPVDLDKSG